MTFEQVSAFAQTGGLFYAIAIFAAVLMYALWPKNQKTFDRAAMMPLDPEDD